MSAPQPSLYNASSPSAQASVSDILGSDCKEGDFTCYKTQVSDNQIVTAYVFIVRSFVKMTTSRERFLHIIATKSYLQSAAFLFYGLQKEPCTTH